MSEEKLRALVRLIIESEDSEDVDSSPDDLLLEPDGSEEHQGEAPEEASVAGAVAGAIVPLGAGPSYPAPERRSAKTARRDTARAIGRAFGGAAPARKK